MVSLPASLRLRAAARRYLALGMSMAGLLLACLPASAAVNVMEYQLKAGFLFNFAKYIEWPAESLPADTAIRLGVIAPDEVFAILEKSLAGKNVGHHAISVERLHAADLEKPNASRPNILFLHQEATRTRADANSLTTQQLESLTQAGSMLIVGESPNFALTGGMIGFVQRGENLRFQVNLASAQRAGLKLSARLAGLAEMVGPSP